MRIVIAAIRICASLQVNTSGPREAEVLKEAGNDAFRRGDFAQVRRKKCCASAELMWLLPARTPALLFVLPHAARCLPRQAGLHHPTSWSFYAQDLPARTSHVNNSAQAIRHYSAALDVPVPTSDLLTEGPRRAVLLANRAAAYLARAAAGGGSEGAHQG